MKVMVFCRFNGLLASCQFVNFDEFVKNHDAASIIIAANAGIQTFHLQTNLEKNEPHSFFYKVPRPPADTPPCTPLDFDRSSPSLL